MAQASLVQFDPGDHSYILDGKSLTPVTAVIEAVLRNKSAFWKDEHRLRGEVTHAIVEAINDGSWDEATTSFPASWAEEEVTAVLYRAYAYQRFVEQTGFHCLHAELRVHSVELGIAGTLDAYGQFSKGIYHGEYAIVDIKSGRPTPAAILQLGLYQVCLPPDLPTPTRRVILELTKEGKCKAEYRSGMDDVRDSLAVSSTFKFMERNRLLPKNA